MGRHDRCADGSPNHDAHAVSEPNSLAYAIGSSFTGAKRTPKQCTLVPAFSRAKPVTVVSSYCTALQ